MPKKRIPWKEQDLENRDLEKYFEFFDLSLRHYYTDVADAILRNGNIEGKVLDIGCGFGILGMMICSRDEFATVTGLENSRIMVKTSEVITARRGYSGRINFKVWEEDSLPFEDEEFSAVVSFLSLHRWSSPEKIFSEIQRVRKKDAVVYVSDFRRDQPALPKELMVQQTRIEMGKEIAADLRNSFKAAYTPEEMKHILTRSMLADYQIEEVKMWLNVICGQPSPQDEKPAPEQQDKAPSDKSG